MSCQERNKYGECKQNMNHGYCEIDGGGFSSVKNKLQRIDVVLLLPISAMGPHFETDAWNAALALNKIACSRPNRTVCLEIYGSRGICKECSDWADGTHKTLVSMSHPHAINLQKFSRAVTQGGFVCTLAINSEQSSCAVLEGLYRIQTGTT